MSSTYFYDPIQILQSSKTKVIKDAALIQDGLLTCFGDEARKSGKKLGLSPIKADKLLLAPCLVDPHSFLEEPFTSKCETLETLCELAAQSGYGQIALLPKSTSYRDRPERLQGLNNQLNHVKIHLWGSFSHKGEGHDLASHAELLQQGAIGISGSDEIIDIELLHRGLSINEINTAPLLIAPRDSKLQGNGIVRQSLEAYRAGWPPDPVISETIPLAQLLEVAKHYPGNSLKLMNISTKLGVEMLSKTEENPMSTVCWWHLLADSSLLNSNSIGLKVTPSIGSPEDRESLIKGLKKGIISAVSVHATAQDEEEIQTPNQLRKPGIVGHQLVLPLLWQELKEKRNWSIEEVWQALSFGPSKILHLPEENLTFNTHRWLIFDPDKTWEQSQDNLDKPRPANQPWQEIQIKGKVISSGLNN